MKKLGVAFLFFLLLAGCSNETFDKAMEQGKLAVAEGNYDKAQGLFELALDEKPKDQEAKTLYESLVAMSKMEEAIKDEKWDEAITSGEQLLKKEDLPNSFKKNVKQKIQEAKSVKEQNQGLSEKVAKVNSLISEKKYTEALGLINEMKKDMEKEESLKSFTTEVNKLEVTVTDAIQKQKEAEVAAKETATETDNKSAVDWSTYGNARFGYTIKYPKGWVLGLEPTNGDGRSLYKENDAEIITYANHYMEETKPDLTGYTKLKTTSGKDAYLRVTNEGGKVTFSGIISNENINFHLEGTMSQEFYEKNASILKEMLETAKLN